MISCILVLSPEEIQCWLHRTESQLCVWRADRLLQFQCVSLRHVFAILSDFCLHSVSSVASEPSATVTPLTRAANPNPDFVVLTTELSVKMTQWGTPLLHEQLLAHTHCIPWWVLRWPVWGAHLYPRCCSKFSLVSVLIAVHISVVLVAWVG